MASIFAHRGYSDRYPENTLLAFQKALDTGCGGIELDVHLTRDRRLAVIHDESVDRTTDGHGLVMDHSLRELQRYDAGHGERIPSLEDYFDLVKGAPVITNIELKNGIFRYEGMEHLVIELVRQRGLEDKVIFSSFNHYSIQRCKQLAPEIQCGLLCDCWIIGLGAYAKQLHVECVHPLFYSLTPQTVGEMKESGVRINTWTVNTGADYQRMVELGVDSIITNNPLLHLS